MQKRSFAVLGLGKYGKSLAEALYDLGMDVLVCDRSPERVEEFSEKATVAVCCDLGNEEEVKALGLSNVDVVIVAMSSDFAASVLCVVLAKEAGVAKIVAKASSARAASILRRLGADRVIDPEAEGGVRSARILASNSIADFFDMDELCMVKLVPKAAWIGKTLRELDLRRREAVNVIALREAEGAWAFVDPDAPLGERTRMLVAMEKKTLRHFE